jgi:toxin FitB
MAADFILLDTNVLSHARKGAHKPKIDRFLSSIPTACIAIPTDAIFELERGALALEATDPAAAKRYSLWLLALLQTDIYVLTNNAKVSKLVAAMSLCGPLKHFWVKDPQSSKLKFGADPRIAAISIVNEIPLATCDVDHYMAINSRFPLPGLYDPVHDVWHVDPPAGWLLQPANENGRMSFDSDWRGNIEIHSYGGLGSALHS